MNSVNELAAIMAGQRTFFDSGLTQDIGFRLTQLKKLRRALDDFAPALEEALGGDLGKHPAESHAKSVFHQLPSVASPVMYSPYTKLKTGLAKLFLR